MRFSHQQKIFITDEIKKAIDRVLSKPMTTRDKLILCAIADAIINLPDQD